MPSRFVALEIMNGVSVDDDNNAITIKYFNNIICVVKILCCNRYSVDCRNGSDVICINEKSAMTVVQRLVKMKSIDF